MKSEVASRTIFQGRQERHVYERGTFSVKNAVQKGLDLRVEPPCKLMKLRSLFILLKNFLLFQ